MFTFFFFDFKRERERELKFGDIQNEKENRRNDPCITKTHPFKYIEIFTTENWKFSGKKFWYFSYFCSKTYIMDTR